MTWTEQQKQIQTNKGLEKKSPKHYEVSTKSTYQTTLRTPILSAEEIDFMSNPAKYINEFSPLYNKALQSSTKDKWSARTDYIKLLIKKALEHSIKDKESQHFIMYLHEIKEDVKEKEPEKQKDKSVDDQLNEEYILKVSELSKGDTVRRVRDSQNLRVVGITDNNVFLKDMTITSGPHSKPKLIEIKNGTIGGYIFIEKYVSPIDTELNKVQKIIDNFKTMADFETGMGILSQISINHHPSIDQQSRMRTMAKVLVTKGYDLENNNKLYEDLISQINSATTTQKLDDLHQDANRAEVSGKITFTQLQEIYMLINDRDEKVRVAQKENLKKLQSQYQVGDFLERLPDIESVIKPGIYTITQIIPHKEMTFGNASPTDVRVVNEYRIAKVNPDGTLNQIGGMVLTATIMSNTFKKTTPNRQSELNKATIEQTKNILIEGINKISTIKGLDEFDARLKEHLIANGITSVQDPRIIDVIVALNKRRRDLSGDMAKGRLDDKIIKQASEWEIKNLQYEATHKPPEMLPPKEISDVTQYVWGVSEQEAIKKYVEKELNKYKSNVDYVQKEKEKLDKIAEVNPYVLLTKAEIQRQYPEKAEEYLRVMWSYKQLKATYDNNMQSAAYWKSKVEKIQSGEWEKINTNYLREQWQKEVKEAIKHGKPVPYDIVKLYPEFTKAQNSRDRYNKGRSTSFANVSIAVDKSHQENTGIKIKRQDGKALDQKTADETIKAVSQLQSVIGDITQIMKREDLTISHTGKKHPFLSTASGIFHGSDITISLGNHTGSHELGGHFIDETAKKRHPEQPLYDYALISFAKKNMNGGKYAIERALSLSKSKSEEELANARELRYMLGSYWERLEEIWSRLIEQYTAYKNRGIQGTDLLHHPYELYIRTPAYWDDVTFVSMIQKIETELNRKIELAKN